MGRRSTHAFALILFLALSLGIWVQRIHVDRPGGYGVAGVDLASYMRPTAIFLGGELRQGRIPLWNPYQMAGMPYLASHIPGALYPPNLALVYLLPTDLALQAETVLHWTLAGFFTWLFAAQLGLSWPARLVAALVYMFSGEILFGAYSPPAISTQAWLPAILWALHGLLRSARPAWVLALASTLALSLLGGYAQAFLHSLQLALVYALFGLVFITPRGQRVRVIALGLAAGVAALGLMAPQILPSLELSAHSVRSFQGTSVEAGAFPALGAAMLAKGLFGRIATDLFGPSAIYQAPRSLLLLSPPQQYLATVPALSLPLIAAGLLARRHRAHWVLFLVAATVTALYLLGAATPVYGAVQSIFLGGFFRGPLRAAFVYVFLMAMLVAIGIEGVQGDPRSPKPARRFRRATMFVLACLVVLGVYSRTELWEAHPALERRTAGLPELIRTLSEETDQTRTFIQTDTVFQRGTQGWLELRPGAPLFRKLGQQHRIPVVPDYEALMPRVYEEYLGVTGFGLMPWHGALSVLNLPPESRRGRELLRSLDLMSVRRYVVPRSVGVEALGQLGALLGARGRSLGPFEIFERPQALPRASVVSRVSEAADLPAALELLRSESFDPAREAVVTGPIPETRALSSLSSGSALVTKITTERVELRASCEGPCLVVLTDLDYPGWKVEVEGEEREILRVNGIFRGVVVDASEHQIVYRYEPGSFTTGLWLCAGALLFLIGLVIALGPPRHAAPSSPRSPGELS
jgi:hypothetical protein